MMTMVSVFNDKAKFLDSAHPNERPPGADHSFLAILPENHLHVGTSLLARLSACIGALVLPRLGLTTGSGSMNGSPSAGNGQPPRVRADHTSDERAQKRSHHHPPQRATSKEHSERWQARERKKEMAGIRPDAHDRRLFQNSNRCIQSVHLKMWKTPRNNRAFVHHCYTSDDNLVTNEARPSLTGQLVRLTGGRVM